MFPCLVSAAAKLLQLCPTLRNHIELCLYFSLEKNLSPSFCQWTLVTACG